MASQSEKGWLIEEVVIGDSGGGVLTGAEGVFCVFVLCVMLSYTGEEIAGGRSRN